MLTEQRSVHLLIGYHCIYFPPDRYSDNLFVFESAYTDSNMGFTHTHVYVVGICGKHLCVYLTRIWVNYGRISCVVFM